MPGVPHRRLSHAGLCCVCPGVSAGSRRAVPEWVPRGCFCCSFISSQVEAGQGLLGVGDAGLDAVGTGLPFPGTGRWAEDWFDVWAQNRGHGGCKSQRVRIDLSSTYTEATRGVVCCPGASLTCASLSVLTQK